MRELESAYQKSTHTVYEHTTMYENDQNGHIGSDINVENQGKYGQGSKQTQTTGFQTDSTGNNQHLRSSDKGIDESNDEFVIVLLIRAVKQAPSEQHYFSGSKGTEKLYNTPDYLKPDDEKEWS